MQGFFQEFDGTFTDFPILGDDVSENPKMVGLVHSKALTCSLTLCQKLFSAYLFSLYYSSFIMLLKMLYVYLKKQRASFNSFFAISLSLCPLKPSEGLWFSDVFRGIERNL